MSSKSSQNLLLKTGSALCRSLKREMSRERRLRLSKRSPIRHSHQNSNSDKKIMIWCQESISLQRKKSNKKTCKLSKKSAKRKDKRKLNKRISCLRHRLKTCRQRSPIKDKKRKMKRRGRSMMGPRSLILMNWRRNSWRKSERLIN